jgi:hypothetical protein
LVVALGRVAVVRVGDFDEPAIEVDRGLAQAEEFTLSEAGVDRDGEQRLPAKSERVEHGSYLVEPQEP